MSSPRTPRTPYQVLDNRPIDQWKVTELKEELKKRRLTIKGLKEDLVKRLDQAVRIEREAAQEEEEEEEEDESAHEEFESAQEQLESAQKEVESAPPIVETVVPAPETDVSEEFRGIAQNDDTKTEKENNIPVSVDTNQENIQEGYVLVEKKETISVEETTVRETVTVTESVVSDVQIIEQDLPKTEAPESEISEKENDESKPKSEEVVQDDSAPESQVPEVSHNLGSPVKYDSISTDSVSINEKTEIKDNIIADNVKLELDNNKPEMVPPSSSSPKVNSHPHAMDVEEPHDDSPIDEKDDVKKFDSVDVGDSEKLNLDRSSGDDSMEEDVPESKQVESKFRPDDDLGDDEGVKIEVSGVKDEEGMVDIEGEDISADKNGDDDEKDRQYTVAEKRKLNDQPVAGSNEPAKRQRRWNSETLKVPEPQISKLSPLTTPKESTKVSKVDSNTEEDALKERIVPPSPKSPTNSLKIDRFLRPFTLKAVQELLGKTGKVTSFWMDHIKTHCYVTYSSVEEATETRNAVYNLQWPPNGGRLLLAEFVDPQEVNTRLEAPPPPPMLSPAAASAAAAPAPAGTSPSLPPPPPLANPPQPREKVKVNLPPPPPLPENVDPTIVTLDDLFRKTRATPRIYYLPLSDEQVAGKGKK